MDTIIEYITDKERRVRRQTLLDSGDLIECTKVARKCGMHLKLAVTPTFFKHLYPYAEDATKGANWEEIMWNVIKLFRKETGGGLIRGVAEFPIVAKTYVKEVPEQGKVVTFSDGKPRDKYMVIMAMLMPDENLNPSVVFSVKDYKVMN